MNNAEIRHAVKYLIDNQNRAEDTTKVRRAFQEIVAYLDENIGNVDALSSLSQLPDEMKVLIIQQYFRHTHDGSHLTEFDYDKVHVLLATWFDIKLTQAEQKGKTPSPTTEQELPGRPGANRIYKLNFGETQIYLYVSQEHYTTAQELVECLASRAIITTDATSPPCVIAEFVPLWLKDRSRNASDYYIDNADDHQISSYFDVNRKSLLDNMGVIIEQPSTEMGIIANADALRFHRDRLVNQYAFLDKSNEPRSNYSVAQSLTLIDWDMQAYTMSGTIFDHPNGDRYLFGLYPGETISFFFTEPAKPLGPMMMPYHCAMPVLDQFSRCTAGAAKGKRLSTVLRGLVKTETLSNLAEASVTIDLNEIKSASSSSRVYANGIKIMQREMPDLQTSRGQILNDQGEALTILEIPATENQQFLHGLLGPASQTATIYRVEKASTGFSNLGHAVPGFLEAERVIVINRSRECPQVGLNYPLAFDFLEHKLPWLQLCPVRISEAIEIPKSVRTLTRLSPPDELLHRSALEDSFYQLAVASPRQVVTVDLVLANPA